MTRTKRTPYVVRPSTAVLTRGFDPRLSVGTVRPAVYRSSTFAFSSPEAAERAFAVALGKVHAADGEDTELIYARLSHPNAEILEDQVVPLEGGARAAAVFNSGMAALATIFLHACRPETTVVATSPLYGGTVHLLRQLLAPIGIATRLVPAGDGAAIEKALREERAVRVLLVETPANPTLRMTDIAAAVRAAAAMSEPPLVVVDNTLLGPVFQSPLTLDADLVVYSATKFLGGFSDLLGGVVLGRDPDVVADLRGARAVLGNILQPDECWLLGTRLPTVPLRMNKQSKNAKRIVEALVSHPAVSRVNYPSLQGDAGQARIRDAQTRYPGSIFSIEIRGGKRGAFEFLRRLRVAHDAVSLGGAESLACHPATTTHSEMEDAELEAAGITPGLVRISVGIEDWRDLLRDFRDALDAC